MNFTELYKKIAEMDGSGMAPHDSTSAINGDEFKDDPIDECGGMMSPVSMSAPKQSDSVTMNVSMNGSGPGGIRDLMSILRNIEAGGEDDHDSMPNPDDLELDIKSMDHPHDDPSHDDHGEEDNIVFGNDMEEEFANEPNEMYASVDDITATGNDMHSKGAERPKVNGGGNPYAVTAEGIQRQLQNLYYEIKSR